jgi:hypothetical protein
MGGFMADETINKELLSGERVLWSGRPDTKKIFSSSDLFLVPFSLLWAGFAIFWEYNAITINITRSGLMGVVFPVFGGFFVVMGLYMMFGRFIYKFYDKKNTVYAITNKRILIVRGLFGKKVNALFIDKIDNVIKSNGSGGFGNIVFGNQQFGYGMYGNSGWPLSYGHGITAPAFYDIAEVDRVYDIFQHGRTAEVEGRK